MRLIKGPHTIRPVDIKIAYKPEDIQGCCIYSQYEIIKSHKPNLQIVQEC